MNKEILTRLGIENSDPNEVLNALGMMEIDLLNKRALAETNKATEAINEIDEMIEMIHQVKPEVAKEAMEQGKEEAPVQDAGRKRDREKKSAIYEEIMKKAAEEEKNRQNAAAAAPTAGVANTKASAIAANGAATAAATAAAVNKATSSSAKATGGTASATAANTPTGGKTAATSSNSSAPIQVTPGNEFSAALHFYKAGDFSNALANFIVAAENKTPADDKAEKDRYMASYMLAMMYSKGEGTNVDKDRSTHYLRRAADLGYDKAMLEYGESVLASHPTRTESDLRERSIGLQYIKKAADLGMNEAIHKYIDIAIKSKEMTNVEVNQAKQYIKLLRNQMDSYEAAKCDAWLADLDRVEKHIKKEGSYAAKYIIGMLLFLVGIIYLVRGLNYTFFDELHPEAGKFLPAIPDLLILKWNGLTNVMDKYMSHQGIFGMWIILLGNAIRGLGSKEIKLAPLKYKKSKKVGTFVTVMVVILCIAHFVLNITEGTGFFGTGKFMQFVVMIGSLLLGRLIGLILFKIFK